MKELRSPLQVANSRDTFREFVVNYLQALDCPRSLAVKLIFESGDHDALTDLDVDPSDYPDGESFRNAYLATEFLRKAEFLNTSFSREERAVQKFLASEEQCRETNKVFRSDSSAVRKNSRLATLVMRAARKIEFVLGSFDPVEWLDNCDWGPGVSSSVKSKVSRETKFMSCRHITPHLDSLIRPLLDEAYPQWSRLINDTIEHRPYNTVTFVPKNAKTHRPIAVEPDLNIWFQKGIGKMIRRRLKRRAGIDLDSQERNQSLARFGSITNLVATLDKSSASDLIAKNLVRFVINDTDWFNVMDFSRSRHGQLREKNFTWEKFSSMGNGFTFELQSLIFWALAMVSVEESVADPDLVSVFGDDVILPSESVPLYKELIEFCGFSLNSSKSFSTGYFRESCGAHWFNGVNCQPFYLKKWNDHVTTVYHAANSVRSLGRRCNLLFGCDARFEFVHTRLVLSLPRRLRFAVPPHIGNGGIILDADHFLCNSVRSRTSQGYWDGFELRVVAARVTSICDDHAGILLSGISARREIALGNSFAIRAEPRYVVRRIVVRRWESWGPWV